MNTGVAVRRYNADLRSQNAMACFGKTVVTDRRYSAPIYEPRFICLPKRHDQMQMIRH